jgi:tripartite-type tricarboxylate transporter receptor subunit TctC
MAILGSHIEVMVCPPDFKTFVRPGQLRFLSSFGQSRLPSFPDIPTWKELGYNIEMIHPAGWVGPKGLPQPVVAKLHGAFKQAVESPQFKRVMKDLEFSIVYRGPEDLSVQMKELTEYYRKLVQQAGIKE